MTHFDEFGFGFLHTCEYKSAVLYRKVIITITVYFVDKSVALLTHTDPILFRVFIFLSVYSRHVCMQNEIDFFFITSVAKYLAVLCTHTHTCIHISLVNRSEMYVNYSPNQVQYLTLTIFNHNLLICLKLLYLTKK